MKHKVNPSRQTDEALSMTVGQHFCCFGVTVIRSDDTLLACGSNLNRQFSADRQQQFTITDDTFKFITPTPLDLPGPVVKVIANLERIFIQLTDGAWVGRGLYRGPCFIPVPKAELVDGYFLPGWTPVNDDYVEELNAREAAVDVMVLPEPIANA